LYSSKSRFVKTNDVRDSKRIVPIFSSAIILGRWNHLNYRRMYSSAYNYVEHEDEYGDISESFWKKIGSNHDDLSSRFCPSFNR